MSDELLVVRAQLGDRSALEDLVARWQRPVWLDVRRMLDAERADDVTRRPGSPSSARCRGCASRTGSRRGRSPSCGGRR